jgi:acetyl/propionyl-CoA carboxylase alpha subunit
MLNIKVNEQEFIFDLISGNAILDGKPVNADTVKLAPNKYHVIINHKSYNIELLEKSENGKTMRILVNGIKQEITIKDKYDALLSQLGMDKVGDQVKKGDALLVLEAMKMENIIKADGEGVVKRIAVEPKQVVEKNTLLIEL